MKRITPIAKDHEVILDGLAVLRLIAGRVEAGVGVDPKDIAFLLDFLRNVGGACLDHTARLILRPALERATESADIRRLRTALACHETVRPLLDDTAADLGVFHNFGKRLTEPSTVAPLDDGEKEEDEPPLNFFGEPDEEFPGCFLLHARMLAKLVEDLILEEDEILLNKAMVLLSDPDGRRKIEEFADLEQHISEIALGQSSTLHRLGAKYDPSGYKAHA
jgi:hypothetical protein